MTAKRLQLKDGTVLFTGPSAECEKSIGAEFPLTAICVSGWWDIDGMAAGVATERPERCPGSLEGILVTGLVIAPSGEDTADEGKTLIPSSKGKPKQKRRSKSEQKRRKALLERDTAEPEDGSDD